MGIVGLLTPVASGLGFEPRLLGPKPSVLPLDDPEKLSIACQLFYIFGRPKVHRCFTTVRKDHII